MHEKKIELKLPVAIAGCVTENWIKSVAKRTTQILVISLNEVEFYSFCRMHCFHDFAMCVTFISVQFHVHLYIYFFVLSIAAFRFWFSYERELRSACDAFYFLDHAMLARCRTAPSVSEANGKKWWQWNEIMNKKTHTQHTKEWNDKPKRSCFCRLRRATSCNLGNCTFERRRNTVDTQ